MKKSGYLWTSIGLAVLATPLIANWATSESETVVKVAKVQKVAIRSTVLASGTFVYENQVLLSPEVIGRVSEIMVKEGDQVKAGDILLRIEDATYLSDVEQRRASVVAQNARVREREAALILERSRLKRVEMLQDRGYAAEATLDGARASYDGAAATLAVQRAEVAQLSASLRQSEATLRKTWVRAPTSGVIVALQVKVGETVVPSSVSLAGSSLLTIAATQTMIAELNVDEADVSAIKLGQWVAMTGPALGGRRPQGRVQSVALTPGRNDLKVLGLANAQGQTARTYAVRVTLPDEIQSRLRAGMTCRAEILNSHSPPTLVVPLQAVLEPPEVDGRDLARLFKLHDGRVRSVRVALGESDDDNQAIRSGIRLGDEVVTGPAEALRGLKDGQIVKTQR